MTISSVTLTGNKPLISFASSGSCIALDDTTFSSITRNTGNGAVLEMTSSTPDLELSNLRFSSCKCLAGSGGAISATLSGNSLSITDCTFSGCSASQYGGAIYVSLRGAGGMITLGDSNQFTSNEAGDDEKGRCLYVSSSQFSLLGECEFSFFVTESD